KGKAQLEHSSLARDCTKLRIANAKQTFSPELTKVYDPDFLTGIPDEQPKLCNGRLVRLPSHNEGQDTRQFKFNNTNLFIPMSTINQIGVKKVMFNVVHEWVNECINLLGK